jgi:hypothetical protein
MIEICASVQDNHVYGTRNRTVKPNAHDSLGLLEKFIFKCLLVLCSNEMFVDLDSYSQLVSLNNIISLSIP